MFLELRKPKKNRTLHEEFTWTYIPPNMRATYGLIKKVVSQLKSFVNKGESPR